MLRKRLVTAFVFAIATLVSDFAKCQQANHSEIGRQILQSYVDLLPKGMLHATLHLDNSASDMKQALFSEEFDKQDFTDLNLEFYPNTLRALWSAGNSNYTLHAKHHGEIYWLRNETKGESKKTPANLGRILPPRTSSLNANYEWRLFWPDWVIFMTNEYPIYNFGEIQADGTDFILPFYLGEKPSSETLNGQIRFSNSDGFQVLEVKQWDQRMNTQWTFENQLFEGVYLPIAGTCHHEYSQKVKTVKSTISMTTDGYTFTANEKLPEFRFPEQTKIYDTIRYTNYYVGNAPAQTDHIDLTSIQSAVDGPSIASGRPEVSGYSHLLLIAVVSIAVVAGITLSRLRSQRQDAKKK